MSLAISKTRTTVGIYAQSICVEVHLSNGLPGFQIVGLPETAIKESKDRIRSALINSQFEFPLRKITVNLAPAYLPKTGSGFDLPIALGILAASGQVPLDKLETHEFIGELALNGNLRGTTAIIPAVIAAKKANKTLVFAEENAADAAIVGHPKAFSARSLREICQYLCQDTQLTKLPLPMTASRASFDVDWSEVKGQAQAKHALIVAAAGGHSVLLSGPPGSGKSMLAKRFITILPELTEEKALECAAIRSLSEAMPHFEYWREPPLRMPHHTASPAALVGGGNPPRPGEISLAHHGVLFLDELPEFPRQVLETLREPLEGGSIVISRAAAKVEFPAQFQLIAAMNPCPCGHYGNTQQPCFCPPDKIKRYLSKLSGPLLDRIDIQINVQSLSQQEMLAPQTAAPLESPTIRASVLQAQQIQQARQGSLNAHLVPKQLEQLCQLGNQELSFIQQALSRLKLSNRAYHRLLKVARTLADMEGREAIQLLHLQQALALRQTIQQVQ